jgi:hypothetical protein
MITPDILAIEMVLYFWCLKIGIFLVDKNLAFCSKKKIVFLHRNKKVVSNEFSCTSAVFVIGFAVFDTDVDIADFNILVDDQA